MAEVNLNTCIKITDTHFIFFSIESFLHVQHIIRHGKEVVQANLQSRVVLWQERKQ